MNGYPGNTLWVSHDMEGMDYNIGEHPRVLSRINRIVALLALTVMLLNSSAGFAQDKRGSTVAIIDPTLPSLDLLLKEIKPGTRIVYLKHSADALSSITKILKHCAPIQSLHIFSEGKPGQLIFSNVGTTDIAALHDAENKLSDWKLYFVERGDILLYGCEIAKGTIGLEFVRALAVLTGLDIAASDNLTGSHTQGGDWFLETQSGTIESQPVIFSDIVRTFPTILRNGHSSARKKEKTNLSMVDNDL